ncbi:hypothetical protein [Butyrivibrio sp. WCD3002]|uniref:hypothetical protein n=1 Tax=Butyrivibrio sp. WCD3002 TaxID=1280676 RepID=UPI0003F642D0|nr:hypothetical protein [Butyrivibrio sp. WCD3002]
MKNNKRRPKMSKTYSTGMIVLLFFCAMYIIIYPQFATWQEAEDDANSGVVSSFEEKTSVVEEDDATAAAIEAIEQKNEYRYFRTKKQRDSHYDKHGIEMGFDSPEAYLDAANALINNPEALHKYEAEDGDDVYYLEATDEIAFVSTDGYIRTYFICSGKDYYDRQ